MEGVVGGRGGAKATGGPPGERRKGPTLLLKPDQS